MSLQGWLLSLTWVEYSLIGALAVYIVWEIVWHFMYGRKKMMAIKARKPQGHEWAERFNEYEQDLKKYLQFIEDDFGLYGKAMGKVHPDDTILYIYKAVNNEITFIDGCELESFITSIEEEWRIELELGEDWAEQTLGEFFSLIMKKVEGKEAGQDRLTSPLH